MNGFVINRHDESYSKNVSVKINGTYSRGLFYKCDEFVGTIAVDDIVFDCTEYTMKPSLKRRNALVYSENLHGNLICTPYFDTVSIAIYKQIDADFSVSTGYAVVAPASNKGEAMQIDAHAFE